MKRTVWKTRLGFYFAAICSSFGLGSLWRFPYVVADNGGGAFVLLYAFLLFIIGTPLLVGELALGKIRQKSIMGSIVDIQKSEATAKLGFNILNIGKFATLLSVAVLSYYAVISGWVFYLFTQFLIGEVFSRGIDLSGVFIHLRNSGGLQLLLTGFHLLFVAIIVMQGVEKGVERVLGFTMPVFMVLLVVLLIKSLSLDGSTEALRFLLYPDFSKFTLSTMANALGHVLFTLSVGFGTLVTFGSYLRENTYLPLAGFHVTVLDSIISLFAGVLIFPLVFEVGGDLSPLTIFFDVVPRFFLQIQGGMFYGVIFFLCLYLAALGASIALLESIVANIRDQKKISRERASIWASLIVFGFAIFPALSSTLFADVSFGGDGGLVFLDKVVVNWLLPISALFICGVVTYRLSNGEKLKLFTNRDRHGSHEIYQLWSFSVKYLIPFVIGLALLLQVIGKIV